MRIRRCSLEGNAVLAVVSFVLLVSGTAFAQKENMLYIFSGQDGAGLYAAVVFDKAGNLYGTTKVGGLYNNGAVFQLSFQASGNWTEKTLYSFKYDGKDGDWPIGSLIFGTKGSLYGTTEVGGVYGAGTVFEVSPQDGGGWSEKILYSFSNIGPDGGYPHAGLLIDSVGNLYGTTPNGGSGGCPDYGCGTVFELIPNKTGGWSEKTLHSFTNAGGDGANPSSNLIFDAHGNLYGTTFNGGVNQYGTAFELSPTKSGQWKETILHTFTGTGSDGGNPIPGLIFDPAANLYGTAWQGGRGRYGTVFELSPAGDGAWTVTVLQSFWNAGYGGSEPVSGLIMDSSGNLFGTTFYGSGHFGNVFQLSPSGGIWVEKVLDTVAGGLEGALIFDERGNLYGVTVSGGAYSDGSVFELER
jgi:uncharacterized repeat protein (TIGR03803 family)